MPLKPIQPKHPVVWQHFDSCGSKISMPTLCAVILTQLSLSSVEPALISGALGVRLPKNNLHARKEFSTVASAWSEKAYNRLDRVRVQMILLFVACDDERNKSTCRFSRPSKL